jgi:hypothetical protein
LSVALHSPCNGKARKEEDVRGHVREKWGGWATGKRIRGHEGVKVLKSLHGGRGDTERISMIGLGPR